MPKAGVRQSFKRRQTQEARAAAEVELEEQLEVVDELGDEEEATSPLAAFLAAPSPETARILVQHAHAGLLTLADIQAAYAQEVVSMTFLAQGDPAVLEHRRMAHVQIQRVLKQLEGVVRKSAGDGGASFEITIEWPGAYLDHPGHQVPLSRDELRLPDDVELEDEE